MKSPQFTFTVRDAVIVDCDDVPTGVGKSHRDASITLAGNGDKNSFALIVHRLSLIRITVSFAFTPGKENEWQPAG
jgi:hypothetical protein